MNVTVIKTPSKSLHSPKIERGLKNQKTEILDDLKVLLMGTGGK